MRAQRQSAITDEHVQTPLSRTQRKIACRSCQSQTLQQAAIGAEFTHRRPAARLKRSSMQSVRQAAHQHHRYLAHATSLHHHSNTRIQQQQPPRLLRPSCHSRPRPTWRPLPHLHLPTQRHCRCTHSTRPSRCKAPLLFQHRLSESICLRTAASRLAPGSVPRWMPRRTFTPTTRTTLLLLP